MRLRGCPARDSATTSAPEPPLPLSRFLPCLALAAAACGADAPAKQPPRLVEPTPERLAALAGADVADALPEAPAVRQALTSAAEMEAFVAACDAEQPPLTVKGSAPPPPRDPAAPDSAPGLVYRGHKPVALPPIVKDRVFRFTEINPEFIDPNKIAESAGTSIVSNLFEPLLVKAAGNSPAVPAAARRYDVSADGTVYTFHLREGLVWSDGRKTTAHDYVYGLRRGLDPATGSRSAQQLWIIAGAKDFNEGKAKDPETVAARAIDDLTLEVRLVAPAPYFPDLVTYVAYSPVPRWAVEAHGDQWTRPEHIVTNGPFRLARWLERDRVELTKDPTFWDAANIRLDGAIVYITDSEAQVRTLYETGQTHVARPLSPDGLQRALAEGRSDLRIDSNACVYYYDIRMDRPPFDDSRVRQALNLAVDKGALVQHVLGAFQAPATSYVPPMLEAFMGYRPPAGLEHDPLRAARLLAAAGFPRGQGFPKHDLLYNTSEGHKRIAEFVSRNWQETLGIDLGATNMEWKSLLKQVKTGDFSLARSAWCADYPDPLSFLENFYSSSENNISAYRNPAYDQVIDRARNEPDRARRRSLLCAAEKALQRDLPFVPMYQYTRSFLIRPEVKGHLPQYQDHHLLRWIWLDHAAPAEPPPPSEQRGGR